MRGIQPFLAQESAELAAFGTRGCFSDDARLVFGAELPPALAPRLFVDGPIAWLVRDHDPKNLGLAPGTR